MSADAESCSAAGRSGTAPGARSPVVVKVGSSSLTTIAGGLDPARLDALVDAIAARRASGSAVVLVSSGAIAAGLAPLSLAVRPRDLATQQAAASVGQMVLGQAYVDSFGRYGITVGQVLLSADDLVRRDHFRNALRTLERLLRLGVVPIVNENDTVATHEIRFGDNDRLAALVAHLVSAAELVLLSDVDALYTDRPDRPGSERIPAVPDVDDLPGIRLDRPGRSGVGSGGMTSKLEAARLAAGQGMRVLLAAADDAALALADGDVGTVFAPTGRRSRSRLFWLRHQSAPRGRLVLDDGAVRAVVEARASLLPAGVVDVAGAFVAGDAVDLTDASGVTVARGLVGYDASELPDVLGRRLSELPDAQQREIVHRDDLVVLA